MPTVDTTTLLISRPAHFAPLETQFQLVRYVLPETLGAKTSQRGRGNTVYARLHTSLRGQLNYPYRTYSFDKLDGSEKWVVYALLPHGETAPILRLGFANDAVLQPGRIAFEQLEFHVLLKLLQIAYFRGVQPGYFVGMDDCYVFASRSKKLGCDICVQIRLQGYTRNQEQDQIQVFHVVGGARPFRHIEEPEYWPGILFGRDTRHGKAYYIHLKADKVREYIEQGKPVYAMQTIEGRRTTLPYHNLQRVDEGLGKILHDSIRGFLRFLANYGIEGEPRARHFHASPKVPVKQAGLPLHLLSPIKIYDNRLQPHEQGAVSGEACIAFLNQALAEEYPALRFTLLADPAELLGQGEQAVLVLQDYEEEDFLSGGLLEGKPDPYKRFYAAFPQVPKQSLNLNVREEEEKAHVSVQECLRYDLPAKGTDVYAVLCQRLEMALYQLYLKDVIVHKRSIRERLPFYPAPYAFLRKRKTNGTSHEILLYAEEDRLQCIDVLSPEGKAQRDQVLEAMGLDWYEVEDQLIEKYHKRDDTTGAVKELTRYDLILGPGVVAELEEINERVLYNYTEVVKRKAELQEPLPVEAFKLCSHYDEIKGSAYPTADDLSALREKNLPQGAWKKAEREGLVLYQRLEAYDALLDEIGQQCPVLSYEELIAGWMHRIAPIFDIKPDANQRYRSNGLRRLYKQRKMFPSVKANELSLYEGIWHDTDNSYLVGSTQGLKMKQEKAHLIRHFDMLQGKECFDMVPLLSSMSIRFIRLRQFTVYPYPLGLINVYLECMRGVKTQEEELG